MAYKTLYIPEGIPNIQSLFPTIDFTTVESWFVEVKDSGNNTLATSRVNSLSCCCTEDKIRIHFINSQGEIDSINFSHPEEGEEVKSDSWEQALSFPLNRTKGGSRRLSIKSNEAVEAQTNCYPETDQYWIKELFETPQAWVEMLLPDGFNTPTVKEYIPIRIVDAKFPIRKKDQRYENLVTIKYEMANSNFNLR